jgi:hypothetical protein
VTAVIDGVHVVLLTKDERFGPMTPIEHPTPLRPGG